LTTTGSSGASTLTSGVLNVPTYSLSGLGGVPTSRTLTINGTTQDLSADRTFTISTGITIGTTAITSGTVGRVLFEGTGNVVQESANLFWDNTNARLGIGGTPTQRFHVQGGNGLLSWSQNAITSLTVENNTVGTSSQASITVSANSNSAQFTKLSTGLTPYKTLAAGDLGIYNTTSDISLLTEGSGKIKFAAGGVSTAQMTLFATGNLAINTTADAGFKLDVNGTARLKGTGDALTLDYTAQSLRFYNDGSSNPIYLIQSNSASKLAVGYTFNYYFSFDHARKSVAISTDSGAGAPQANASAVLDLTSTSKGFLPPRMTTTQKNAIATPATGLMVYDTTLNLMALYNGTTWTTL
jgi:hypothetical protein